MSYLRTFEIKSQPWKRKMLKRGHPHLAQMQVAVNLLVPSEISGFVRIVHSRMGIVVLIVRSVDYRLVERVYCSRQMEVRTACRLGIN